MEDLSKNTESHSKEAVCIKKVLTPEEIGGLPEYGYPKTYTIEGENGAVLFFGGNHSYNPNDEQFVRLRSELEQFQPDLVLIENEHDLNIERREEIARLVSTKTPEELVVLGSERFFAIQYASTHDVSYDSAEPSQAECIKELELVGLERRAIFCHYLTRTIPKWIHLNALDKDLTLKDYLQKTLDDFKEKSGWQDFDFSYEHFENAMGNLTGMQTDEWIRNSHQLSNPIPGEHIRNPLNKVARELSYFRNKSIVKKVLTSRSQYPKIAIVYGASHAWALESALAEIYGDD